MTGREIQRGADSSEIANLSRHLYTDIFVIRLVFILLTITYSDVRQLEEMRKSARISRHFELTGQEQMHLTEWNSEFGCAGMDLRGAKLLRARRTRKKHFKERKSSPNTNNMKNIHFMQNINFKGGTVNLGIRGWIL